MQVFQREQHEAAVGQPLQDAEHALRHPAAALLGGLRVGKCMVDAERIQSRAKVGDQRGHVVPGRADHGAEPSVRDLRQR